MKQVLNILFILVIHWASAQQPSHSIIGEEELAGINIYSMIQDNDNTVWLSTNNGLFHYDGLKFTPVKSSIVNDQSLFGLDKDNNGTIFCYNLSGQILYIENKELKQYCQIPEKHVSGVMYYYFDTNNDLILSCKSLLKFKKKQNTFTTLYSFKSGVAQRLAKDKKGKIHFCDEDIMLTFYNDKVIAAKSKVPYTEKFTNQLFMSYKDDFLYFVNTSPDFIKKAPNRSFEKVFMPMHKDNSMVYYPYVSKNKNLIWFTNSKNGIYCFSLTGMPLFNGKKLFKDYFISSYFEDNEGNYWLSTFGKGIILIPNLNVIDYSNEDLIAKDDLYRITKKENSLYFGGIKGNVYKLSNDKINIEIENSRKIESIKFLSKCNSFFINDKIYDANLKSVKGENSYNKYDVFQNSLTDSIFYVTRSGLFYLDLNFNEKKLDYDTRTYCLYNDEKRNVLWLGSSTGLEIKKHNKFKKILVDKLPVFATEITSINGQIWLGTSVGILIYENEKLVERIRTENKLLSNTVLKIIHEQKFVYISTNEGLQRYDLTNKTFKNFTKSDGLLSNAILDFEVLDNQIYLITSKGIQRFSFEDVPVNKKLPQITINKVIVNGFKSILNNQLLPSDENNLEFSFMAVTHKDKRNLKYEYKLDGFDEKWYTTDFTNNSIKYAKLPAGEYRFNVRLKDDASVSKEIKTFQFEVETVFWKKWQFISVVVISIMILFIVYYRKRINNLVQKKNEEIEKQKYIQELNKSKLKALKSQMNPHFMFNALNSIQEFILQNKKELASNYLGDFADLMRSYLQHSQEDTISLRDEIETLDLYLKLEQIRFEEDFTYQIKYNKDLAVDAIEIPSFLLQPFVENAIKHGLLHKKGDKRITVEFIENANQILECSVIDNGIGRKESERIIKSKKHKSFATEASQDRLNLLNQNVKEKIGFMIEDLYDEEGNSQGTKVTLTIPVLKQ